MNTRKKTALVIMLLFAFSFSYSFAEDEWPATPKAFTGKTTETIVADVKQIGGITENATFFVSQISYVDNVLRYIVTANPTVDNLLLVSVFDDYDAIRQKEIEYDSEAQFCSIFDDTGALGGYSKDSQADNGLVTEIVQLLPADASDEYEVNINCVLGNVDTGAITEETVLSFSIAPTGVPQKAGGKLSFSDGVREYKAIAVSTTPQYTTILLTYGYSEGKTPAENRLRFDVVDANKQTMIGAGYFDREQEEGVFNARMLVAPFENDARSVDLWLDIDKHILRVDLNTLECEVISAESIPSGEGYLSNILY